MAVTAGQARDPPRSSRRLAPAGMAKSTERATCESAARLPSKSCPRATPPILSACCFEQEARATAAAKPSNIWSCSISASRMNLPAFARAGGCAGSLASSIVISSRRTFSSPRGPDQGPGLRAGQAYNARVSGRRKSFGTAHRSYHRPNHRGQPGDGKDGEGTP